jgi:hypothetical protein
MTGARIGDTRMGKGPLVPAGLAGFVAGAAVGYLYRPPALLIGQLPFKYVITRGTSLKGIDQIYIPTAEASFNYLLAGGLVGAGVAVAAILFLKRGSK